MVPRWLLPASGALVLALVAAVAVPVPVEAHPNDRRDADDEDEADDDGDRKDRGAGKRERRGLLTSTLGGLTIVGPDAAAPSPSPAVVAPVEPLPDAHSPVPGPGQWPPEDPGLPPFIDIGADAPDAPPRPDRDAPTPEQAEAAGAGSEVLGGGLRHVAVIGGVALVVASLAALGSRRG